MKPQTFCQFQLGYDSRVMCPPAKAGALMALLAECTFVTNEWMDKGPDALVIKDAPLEMKLGLFTLVTRTEYDALRQAETLAKEEARNAELQS